MLWVRGGVEVGSCAQLMVRALMQGSHSRLLHRDYPLHGATSEARRLMVPSRSPLYGGGGTLACHLEVGSMGKAHPTGAGALSLNRSQDRHNHWHGPRCHAGGVQLAVTDITILWLPPSGALAPWL